MDNKYMFVCPNCLETYSSDSKTRKKCQVCGSDLVEMPISVSEWRMMEETQKEQYKREYVRDVMKKGFYYTVPATTPFNWHKFNMFFRVPSTFLQAFTTYYQQKSIPAIDILILLASFLFEINASKKNKTALYSILSVDILQIIGGLIITAATKGSGYGMGPIIIGVCEFIYYLRRKNFFMPDYEQFMQSLTKETSNTPDNVHNLQEINSEQKQNNIINQHPETKRDADGLIDFSYLNQNFYDNEQTSRSNTVETGAEQNSRKILFCRNCGARLNENATFCHRCGKRV